MVVKVTPSARAMPGIEGRYMLIPSGLTAETAMSRAIKPGFAMGGAAVVVVWSMGSGSLSVTLQTAWQVGCASCTSWPVCEARQCFVSLTEARLLSKRRGHERAVHRQRNAGPAL